MDTQTFCSGCQKPLPATAPQGLCPECLMKAALGTGVDIGPETQAGRPKIPFTPPAIAELAAHFPQLEILEFIAQGGMGAVYKARQKQLDRLVALKILPPQAVNSPGFADRFTREARALAKLNHPHIVTLYEFGQSDGLFYFLMEFVDGVNLQQLMNTSRVAPNEALAIVPQICDALQFAHQRGIVHRDIKPGNILLSKEGQVKIADFGVAKIMADSLDGPTDRHGAKEPGELTEAGSVLGTPQYMAPEQMAHPLAVDHRADIYSLGVVFYQMLTGELPTGKFEPPSKKVVIDVRLDEVVLRALEKTPALRYQQVGEVKTQIETIAATGTTGSAAAPAANLFPGPVPLTDLKQMGQKTILWAVALAAGALEMGFNVTPVSCGILIGTVGVVLSVAASALALICSSQANMLGLAKRLISINGIFISSSSIWVAATTPSLNPPWHNTIIVVCLGGIVYCLRCLVGPVAPPAASNPHPMVTRRQRRFRKLLRIELPAALIIALVIRAFFLQPFKAETDAAAPEIPRHSRFLVWKLAQTFAFQDIIAYRQAGMVNVGRVIRTDPGGVLVNRNGQAGFLVPRDTILGKVISVYWRATDEDAPTVNLRPSTGGPPNFSASNSGIEARAVSLGTVISYAYGIPTFYIHWSEVRVQLPPGVADIKFDFQIISPHPQEDLRAVIKNQLGLVAHREKRETNVLVLAVSDASLVLRAAATGGNGSDGTTAPGRWDFANMPIDDVSDFLESTLGTPVINETELTEKFSGRLRWDPQSDPAAKRTEIEKILASEFGLELAPGREAVEMLVVEKVK